jgi:hypothetical protein
MPRTLYFSGVEPYSQHLKFCEKSLAGAGLGELQLELELELRV